MVCEVSSKELFNAAATVFLECRVRAGPAILKPNLSGEALRFYRSREEFGRIIRYSSPPLSSAVPLPLMSPSTTLVPALKSNSPLLAAC